MDDKQARELGQRLRQRREQLELTIRELAEAADTTHTTVVRFEQGAYSAPAPDKLSRIAEALGLEVADVFALADYAAPSGLPSFRPYLRTKYRDLPTPALEELERSFRRIAKRHGINPDGPAPGEDEQPEPAPKHKKGGDHGRSTRTATARRKRT